MIEGTFSVQKKVSEKTGKEFTVIVLNCNGKEYLCFDTKVMGQIAIDNLQG